MDVYKFIIHNKIFQKMFIEDLVNKNYEIKRDADYSLDESNCFVFWGDGQKVTMFTRCNINADVFEINDVETLKNVLSKIK